MFSFIRKRKIQKIKQRNVIAYATNPGEMILSRRKTWDFFISINTIQRTVLKNSKYKLFDEIQYWLYYGDCNPAILVSNDPIIVAAYSYDIDCVVFLLYSQYFSRKYKLEVGAKLLSVNMYGNSPQEDIVRGEKATGPWKGYRPLIADFLSNDLDIIKSKKESINEEHWERCRVLSKEYPSIFPDTYRFGDPFYAINPSILRGKKVNPFDISKLKATE